MKLKDGFKGEQSLVLPKAITDMMERDPLASLVYITDIGYYPNARHHFRSREEPIGEHVFIYCVKGKGWYTVGSRRYEVKSNHYFILPAGEPHTYASSDDEPWTIYWIHFSGSLADYYLLPGYGPHEISPSMESRINSRNNLFEEIFNTLNTSFSIESIRYAMASFHHYLASLRYIRQYRGSVSKGDYSHADLERIVGHFFLENLGRTLTLGEVAEYVGLPLSTLSTRFKAQTGHSPLQYFNLMKVRRACELLDTTPLTVSQVSMKLGIEDPYYFSRLFSKTMGLSPRAYRSREKP